MNLHCPCCHAQFSIEAITQDEAARELLGFKAVVPPSLWSYLSLFRSETRALSWERALKLAKEVLELAETARLEAAMSTTIEALRGNGRGPLKNHNYLKKVLADTSVTTNLAPQPRNPVPGQPSKTATAIGRLENWKNG